MVVSKEIWEKIKGYPLYEVSNLGRVISYNSRGRRRIFPKLMKPGRSSSGYYTVVLYNHKRGTKISTPIHNLVATAFLGHKPKKYDVCHKDESRTNNKVDNLEYGTRSYNNIMAVKSGRKSYILTPKDIPRIRKKREQGLTYREIGEMFGVKAQTIMNVINGRTWKYV